ncbi:hypothetical protein K7W42_21460 [Deinococcus sp. HMF7604]|uniref:hypothetical protein n=1 Tax=Deinococcus betulae TaxID=2873312 RepID=UPI001CD00602|nr:hypothetical protein [Deinococcus betulae]
MTRLLLALAGVVLLAVTALAAVWLVGQLLTGLGAFIVGTAGVLGRLLWFLLVAGGLSGLVFFVASAWRPAGRLPAARRGVAPAARPSPPPTAVTLAPAPVPAARVPETSP